MLRSRRDIENVDKQLVQLIVLVSMLPMMAGILKIVRYSVGEMRPIDGGDCTSCTRLVQWTPRVSASPALPALPHTQYTHTQSHNCRHGSRLGAGRRGWDAAEQRSRGRLAAASDRSRRRWQRNR